MKGLISDGGQPPVKPIRGLYSNQHVHQTAVVPTSCRFLLHTGLSQPTAAVYVESQTRTKRWKVPLQAAATRRVRSGTALGPNVHALSKTKAVCKIKEKIPKNAQRDARYHTPRTNFWHTHPGRNFRGSLPLGPKRCVVPTMRFREVVHESVTTPTFSASPMCLF
ncbi:unnamed protein product [Ectocarpus sp. 4 AP-2014]